LRRLIIGPEAEGLFTLFGILYFLVGVIITGLGLVGEYVGRIFAEVKRRPLYLVGERVGLDGIDVGAARDERQTPRPALQQGHG
jgi:hypothetical protein